MPDGIKQLIECLDTKDHNPHERTREAPRRDEQALISRFIWVIWELREYDECKREYNVENQHPNREIR